MYLPDRRDVEETGSDPRPAALHTGLGLGGLHPCYGPMEVSRRTQIKGTDALNFGNLQGGRGSTEDYILYKKMIQFYFGIVMSSGSPRLGCLIFSVSVFFLFCYKLEAGSLKDLGIYQAGSV